MTKSMMGLTSGLTKDQEEPELVPFKCRKCGELIIYAIPTAQVWCRHCQRWVKANESAPQREVVKNAL
jgi:ribosomal protein S27E